MRLTGRTSSKLIVRRVFVEVRPDESHRTSSKTRRTMSSDEVRPANLDEPHRFDEVRPVNLIEPHRELVDRRVFNEVRRDFLIEPHRNSLFDEFSMRFGEIRRGSASFMSSNLAESRRISTWDNQNMYDLLIISMHLKTTI